MTPIEAVFAVQAAMPTGPSKLKLSGPVKPFDYNGHDALKMTATFDKPLETITHREIQAGTKIVLDKLAALDGFFAAEPDPGLKACGYEVYAAVQGDLRLNIIQMHDPKTLEAFTHVFCCYHPA